MNYRMTKQSGILDIYSQWVGESLIRTTVRQLGKKNKIVVDVQEIAPRHTSKQRAAKAAMDAARRVGCMSVDYSNVSDTETIRKSHRLDTDELVRTKVRTMTFVFNGLPQ